MSSCMLCNIIVNLNGEKVSVCMEQTASIYVNKRSVPFLCTLVRF